MAESGAGDTIGSLLENWSNIGNLFLAFVIAGLVPLLKHFGKKYTKWKDKKDAEEAAREKAAIVDIAREVQQPVTTRMDKMEELMSRYSVQNEKILDHMNIIEQLLQSGKISFRGPGRPSQSNSKHFDHSSGSGDKSGYNPK